MSRLQNKSYKFAVVFADKNFFKSSARVDEYVHVYLFLWSYHLIPTYSNFDETVGKKHRVGYYIYLIEFFTYLGLNGHHE